MESEVKKKADLKETVQLLDDKASKNFFGQTKIRYWWCE